MGYLSPTVGDMEIYILRAAELLCTMCTGCRPSSGLADNRFIVPEDNNYPSVRGWPGFEARRVVVLGDKRFDVFCCAQESSVGRIYTTRALVEWNEDERFTVDGETNLSFVVDSARLWSGFQARRVA